MKYLCLFLVSCTPSKYNGWLVITEEGSLSCKQVTFRSYDIRARDCETYLHEKVKEKHVTYKELIGVFSLD